MKKTIGLAVLAVVSLGSLALPAVAADRGGDRGARNDRQVVTTTYRNERQAVTNNYRNEDIRYRNQRNDHDRDRDGRFVRGGNVVVDPYCVR